ncbi:alpha/beta hydrolase [Amycolatopsis sp. A133]|uniref:alpha/beta fold hydrolase n=1 Tax=Amycolatopsis sp. A133 TaxID=3064472 RepID=UPI0027E90D24|nr:alpha/beta hydrolase [Amycolatopsis sp. A133]MDQ7807590.1 alpha/beta hydrolase [Amycolatopsis sp. A133]
MNQQTFVLVHGALTDASVWRRVSARLQDAGHTVIAPSLPMRDFDGDVAYLKQFLATLTGPLVVAAHSYAGSVISAPGALTENVRSLVFVTAFQQDAGETAGALNGKFPGSLLIPDNLVVRESPGGSEIYLRPDKFGEVYAGDAGPRDVKILAAAQKPFSPVTLEGSFANAASWHGLPSWAVVSTRDSSIPAEAQRWMAERAGSTVVEVDSTHAVPLVRPDVVAETILSAAG